MAEPMTHDDQAPTGSRRSRPPASPSGSTTCPASASSRATCRARHDKHVVGVTTNPSIFAAALAEGERVRRPGRRARPAAAPTVDEAVFALTTDDVRDACDVLPDGLRGHRRRGRPGLHRGRPAPGPRHRGHRRAGQGSCGARSTARTCSSRSRRPSRACRPSPQALAEGISVNVTLIFALDRYRGRDERLPRRPRAGPRERQGPVPAPLGRLVLRLPRRHRGRQAARRDRHRRGAWRCAARPPSPTPGWPTRPTRRSSPPPRWKTLADDGAHAQRPLWASTGVKDPAYPDTMYVAELVAPGTVNTMPEKTLDAAADHGEVTGDTVTRHLRRGREVLDASSARHRLRRRSPRLEKEGVDKFETVLGRAARTVERHRCELAGQATTRAALDGRRRRGAGRARPSRRTCPTLVEDAGRQPALRPGRHAVGPRGRGRVGQAAVLGRPAPDLAAARRRDRRPARRAAATRASTASCSAAWAAPRWRPRSSAPPQGVRPVVLDSTDPDLVRAALADDLDRTVVVVSSKSGSTVETDSPAARLRAGLHRGRHRPARPAIVIVTDPGCPLDGDARAAGYRVVNADPDVGGRYSALTAFGLVPSGLAGADVGGPARRRRGRRRPARRRRRRQPGAARSARRWPAPDAAARQARPRRRRLRHRRASAPGPSSSSPSPPARTAPASCRSSSSGTDDPEVALARRRRAPSSASVGDDDDTDRADCRGAGDRARLVASPARSGAQLLLWEVATAVAGRLLGINPFDQPDVESAKNAARELLDAAHGAGDEPGVHRRRRRDPRPRRRLARRRRAPSTDAVDALLAQLDPEHGYVAVMAYLDRWADADLEHAVRARPGPAHRAAGHLRLGAALPALHRPVPQGRPGHRRLPAGHRHARRRTSPSPGRDFTFGDVIAAQAGGDATVLADHGRPVLRLHLTDHDAGLAAGPSGARPGPA